MWPSIARTRRRLLGTPDASGCPVAIPPERDLPAEVLLDESPGRPPGTDDAVLSIGRAELEQLVVALQTLLGPDTPRPDTPDRLEAALAAAVERLGGGGRPRVTRCPPGLYTPETWQVRLANADPSITAAIRGAARGTGFDR